MIKPIFIIKIPRSVHQSDYSKISDSLKKDGHQELRDHYHILIIGSNGDEFEFQGLYPKDFDIESLEEVKRKLGKELIEIIK